MSNKGQLLQDPFLNTLRKEHVPVSIYLVNGIKLQGQIESFDQYVVLLKNSVTQMVYKHAISTVVPSRADQPRRRARKPTPEPRERPAAADPRAAVIVCLDFGDDGYEDGVEEVVRLVQSAGVRALRRWCAAGAAGPTRELYAGSGKVEEIGRAAAALNAALRGLQPRRSRPAQQRNLEKELDTPRARPHRADPGDLRAARADQRRQAAGRAGAAASTCRRAWCAAGPTSSASAAASARPAARARSRSSWTGATSPSA